MAEIETGEIIGLLSDCAQIQGKCALAQEKLTLKPCDSSFSL